MKFKVATPILLALMMAAGFSVAQTTVTEPDQNTQTAGRLYYLYNQAFPNDSRLNNLVKEYRDLSDERFQEHMEIVRIASPSRQEYYRAKALHDRLLQAGFTEDEIVFTGSSGRMDGSAVQQVDGRPVYQTCAKIEGLWNGAVNGAQVSITDPETGVTTQKAIWARPKVVIEGHIDTVNPASIPNFDPIAKPDPWYFEPIKMQPVWDWTTGAVTEVVKTAEAIAALPFELSFDPQGKVIPDPYYTAASIVYNASIIEGDVADWTDKEKLAYRLLVPGYGDAIGNTIGVYYLAKLFKAHPEVKPVYDIWFCFTAGEEGRGNLAGMKQLYGYNQQNAATVPGDNGKNRLNIVANLSIDGGTMSINYLGSYRYEVNYKGEYGALEAARSIAAIADVKAPTEDNPPMFNPQTQPTTYTVGIAYQKPDGSTSFEIDMRAPTAPPLNEMRDRLYPKFRLGTTNNGVEIAVLWYGDRPPHRRSDWKLENDPMIYMAWKTYADWLFKATPKQPKFTLPTGSSSLNDNIPGAMDIPSLNMNLSAAAGDGAHAINEWGIRGEPALEETQLKRVLYTLLVASGLNDDPNTTTVNESVSPFYPEVGPRHTNDVWDN